MEEKERYEIFGKHCIKDNDQNARPQLLDAYVACVILNEQDKRIKELEEENKQLKQQLEEKDKEIEKYRNANIIVLGGRSQGKKHLMEIKIKELQNQKAVEQLEKVKEFVNEIYGEYSASITTNFIDNQINELKGKVEDDTNKQQIKNCQK